MMDEGTSVYIRLLVRFFFKKADEYEMPEAQQLETAIVLVAELAKSLKMNKPQIHDIFSKVFDD